MYGKSPEVARPSEGGYRSSVRSLVLALVVMATLASRLPTSAAPPVDPETSAFVITPVTVIDVRHGRRLPDHSVVVEGNRQPTTVPDTGGQ